jgi:hypothetical protein
MYVLYEQQTRLPHSYDQIGWDVRRDRAGAYMLSETHPSIHLMYAHLMQASEVFAKDRLPRGKPIGKMDFSKVNVLGGSLALGHPFGE